MKVSVGPVILCSFPHSSRSNTGFRSEAKQTMVKVSVGTFFCLFAVRCYSLSSSLFRSKAKRGEGICRACFFVVDF